MLATYEINHGFFVQKCNLQLVTLCLFTMVPYTMIITNKDAVLGSTF